MTGNLDKARRRAEMIREDVGADAAALDRTPFDKRGVGETFGNVLAICGALAACVVELCDTIEELKREAQA